MGWFGSANAACAVDGLKVDAADKDLSGKLGGKKTVFSLRHLISHRLVILKARLVLLLVIAAVILLTAGITWRLSLKAADESFSSITDQLREDVTVGAVNELKNLIERISVAISTLYISLDGLMPDYSWETLSGPALPPLWATFNTYKDTTTLALLSSEGWSCGYRRNGPESAILHSADVVGLPPPKNETDTVLYGYIPDPDTGAPLLQGPYGKACVLDRCPNPLEGSEYAFGTLPQMKNPIYLLARRLPRRTFFWGVSVDNGFEPYLFVAGALKNASGDTAAVVSITAASTKLQRVVKSTVIVQAYGGRMFITLGLKLNMVTASNGTLFLPPPLGIPATFIPATNSSDQIIREASIYMNATYGHRMFTQPIRAIMHIRGGASRYYVNSMPLQHEGMQLIVFLVVPRTEFWGAIDASRHHGLTLIMCVGLAVVIVGGLAACLSTIALSQVLTTQEAQLGEAAAANEALTVRLAALMQEEASLWPHVDMGTPLQKLTAILKGLKPGHVLSLPHLRHMLGLVTSDDLHRPHFLEAITSAVEASGSEGGSPSPHVDGEMGRWIHIFSMGRRGPSLALTEGDERPLSPFWRSASLPPLVGSGEVSPWMQDCIHEEGSPEEPSPSGSRGDNDASLDGAGSEASSLPAGDTMATTDVSITTLQAASPLEPRRSSARFGQKSIRLHAPAAPYVDINRLETLHLVASLAVVPTDGDPPGRTLQGPDAARLDPPVSLGELVLELGPLQCSRDEQASLVCLVPAVAESVRQQSALLWSLGEWEFDTLALERTAPGSVLPLVGFALFAKTGLMHAFDISKSKLANFLEQVARVMPPHPYHNAVHVADASASLCFLLMGNGIDACIRPIDKLAAMVAVLVHDYKHPGVNNDFLARTRDDLATIYNDESPLENYHLAEAFQLLYSNDHCNFLEVLSDQDFAELRHVVIQMVLASDLKRHFGILDAFRGRASQGTPWDVGKDSDRLLLLQMALKVADIGHTAKALDSHVEWSRRVTEEFYCQGDAEREANLTISPFMDRFNNNVPRSQLGFFQFLALPLLRAWTTAFPRSAHLLSNATTNMAYWKNEFYAASGE